MGEKKKPTQLPGCPMTVNYLNTFALGIKILLLELASCPPSAWEGGGRRSDGCCPGGSAGVLSAGRQRGQRAGG